MNTGIYLTYLAKGFPLIRPLVHPCTQHKKDTSIIPGEHRLQILKHITEQDSISQNEINGDHISLTAVVTTVFFDREKHCL